MTLTIIADFALIRNYEEMRTFMSHHLSTISLYDI